MCLGVLEKSAIPILFLLTPTYILDYVLALRL